LPWTAQNSQFVVSKLLASRFNLKLTEPAQKRHATAEAAEKLATAIKDAAVPKRHLSGKP